MGQGNQGETLDNEYVYSTPFGGIRIYARTEKQSNHQMQALIHKLDILHKAIELAFSDSKAVPDSSNDDLKRH